jgi:hypothetical protein
MNDYRGNKDIPPGDQAYETEIKLHFPDEEITPQNRPELKQRVREAIAIVPFALADIETAITGKSKA